MARRASGAAGQPGDLVRMRQRLDEWRGSHARGGAFSAAVWTARAQGLEYNKLKGMSGVIGRVPGKAKRPSKPDPMKFIELSGALPVSPSGCRLSLQNANGQRLQLEMAPGAATEMVLQLCRSGWSALP